MTLPVLPLVQGAYFATGSATPTSAQVVTAIQNAFAAATYWEVAGSGSTYVRVRPKNTSETPDIELIFCDNPTTHYLTPDTSATCVWGLLSPDAGNYSYVNYATTTPYGASARTSGYSKACANALVENVYLLETSEFVVVVFVDDSADDVWCYGAGALITPLEGDTGRAEADGRVYGIFTSGITAPIGNFHGSSTALTHHSTSNNGAHLYYFDPTSPATIRSVDNAVDTANYTNLATTTGRELVAPISLIRNSAPSGYVGELRQIYASRDALLRESFLDVDLVNRGYFISGNAGAAADAIVVTNFVAG